MSETRESLPAIIDRARNHLEGARTSAEVLEARAIAQAALHYAKVQRAANDTQAECLRMIVRAEMRMANEIDRGQETGEIRTNEKRTFRTAESPPASLAELNISPQRAAEWREIRDAGESVVDGAIAKALAEGRAPTKTEILTAAKQIRAEKAEQRRDERIERLVEISRGNKELVTDQRYPVIYADPPWRYEHIETESRAIENQYPTMDLDAICAMPVADLATEDAILFLWTTAPKLEEAFRVLSAWGFSYRTCAIWDKQKIGMGYYFRVQHELLLVATRGSIPTPAPSDRPSSVISLPRTEHSAKPAEFYSLIETFYPTLPKIELFCRSSRQGWAAWGNQASEAA